MTFGSWTARHVRSLLFLIGSLAVVGVAATTVLPSSLFPAVDFPRVALSLDAGDMPAEQMEIQVTRPIETAIRRVPGVTNVRSTTSRGSGEISINFGWGTDMAAATLQVDAAAGQVHSRLPQGTTIVTRRMDPTVFPIIAYSLTSDTVSATKLREIADFKIAPVLSGIAGISRAEAIGGAVQEFQAIVDPTRLQGYGLTVDDVAKAIASASVVTAVGKIEDHYKLLLVLDDSSLHGLDDLADIIVARSASGAVHLRDIGVVRQGIAPQWTRVTADGKPAVSISIYQQPGGNTVQIAIDVKARLAELQPQLPPGIKIAGWYDQSGLITASASSVRDAILIGAVLAAIVLMLFLRDLKVTVIAVTVVPTVLATTVALLYALGMSFNVMTLGGMAAAVGLIIDDGIVMIEHIVRRLRQHANRDADVRDTIICAANEFLQPLLGSSAATLVIFAPLAFLSGVTGAFFKALSITMASSLFISLVVTAVAVPLLAGLFLGHDDAARHDDDGKRTRALKDRYGRWMERILLRPWLAVLAAVPLVLVGALAFTQVGSGFMPHIDEGGFVLDYRTPPGTALTETDRLLRQVEQIVRQAPDVDTYSRRTGLGLGGTLNEPNQGDFFIRLKGTGRRPLDVVMEDIRTRVEQQVPGVEVEMAQLMEDLIGDLTAVPQPVEIKLFSDHATQLDAVARNIAGELSKVQGVVDVKDGINPAGDGLAIRVDRTRADLEGFDPTLVGAQLSDALTGKVATTILSGVKAVGIRVWIPSARRDSIEDVQATLLHAPDGHAFPLSRIASVETVIGQPEIGKENLKRMVAVTARLNGRDLGSVMGDVKAMLSKPNALPAGMYFELGGLYAQQQRAFQGLMVVFASAAGLVFLLMLFMYESFAKATAIMTTSLMAVSAVFIGLWITGVELNITAMMGMTMIIGIVTEVGIFYFCEQSDLETELALHPSLVQAGQNRMRPIAMTTIAAIVTLLPLPFAIGQGSEMQQPLAIAIISGLVVQLPLVLFVMPALFALMAGRRRQAAGDGSPERRAPASLAPDM